ncbi:hypothetical protein [Candidatus Nitrospira bockiana]
MAPAVYAADASRAQERFEKQMGQEGNAMGVPVPGSVSDMEDTHKQRDASKVESSETLPRIPHLIEGEILTIDGSNYDIRSTEGERVSLRVNADTNLVCAGPAKAGSESGAGRSETLSSERLSPKEQAPEASERQLAQGQRQDETARGSGFRVGNCDFKAGDRIKAEVDDNNRVTTLKQLASSSE